MKSILKICFCCFLLAVCSCKKEEGSSIQINIPDSVSFPIDGGAIEAVVSSNVSWQAITTSSWISITPNMGMTEKSNVLISTTVNPSSDKRTGTIILSSIDEKIKKEIAIIQNGYNITISLDNWEPLPSGETVDVLIDSDVSWEARTDKSWLSISRTSATPGSCRLSITAGPNGSEPERTGTVTIYNQKYALSKQIHILQKESFIALSKSSCIFDWNEGSESLTATSNCSFNITASQPWITCSSTQGMSGANTFTVSVEKNTSSSTRNGKLLFVDKGTGASRELSIAQNCAQISMDNYNWSPVWAGETKRVKVTSDCDWSISSDSGWATFSPASGTKGDSYVDIMVSANPLSVERRAALSFCGTANQVKTAFSIIQKASSLSTSVSQLSSAWDGETLSFDVVSDCEWTYSTDSQWMSCSPSGGNSGTTKVSVVVAKNTTTSKRKGEIKVNSVSTGSSTSVNIEQDVAQISIIDEPKESRWSGEILNMTVSSNCQWKIEHSVDWFSTSVSEGEPGASGLTVTTQRNEGNAPRTGQITIINIDSGVKKDVVVKQLNSIDYVDEYGINHGKGYEINGITWSPVNCGYKTPSSGDKGYPYGKLYQWGRARGNGGYSNTDQTVYNVVSGSFSGTNGTDDLSKAYGMGVNYANWISPFDNTFWYGPNSAPERTQYDPCPTGWRVSTDDELQNVCSNHSNIVSKDGQYGIWAYGSSTGTIAEDRKIFLPASGGMSIVDSYSSWTHRFEERDKCGYYWTSYSKNNKLMPVRFYFSGIPTASTVAGHFYNGSAYSVRCVRE